MKKILSLISFLMMAMTLQAAITIYVKSDVQPYLYAWWDGGQNASWPGVQLTETKTVEGTQFWYYTFDESLTTVSIIFNDGNGNQTGDITGVTSDAYYTYDGTKGFADISEQYVEVPDVEISTLALKGNQDGWTDDITFSEVESGTSYSLIVDLTDNTSIEDGKWQFKIRPNGLWVGYSQVTLDAPEWCEQALSDNFLINLDDASLVSKKFTFTATWSGGKYADQGWTIKIVNESVLVPIENNAKAFLKVTSLEDLTDGSKLLIVYEDPENTDYALGNQLTNGAGDQTNRNAAVVNVDQDRIVLDEDAAELPTVFTLGKVTGGYSLFGNDGKFLTKAGASNYNRLGQADNVNEMGTWTITIADGVTKIRNVGDTNFYIQKNTASKVFAAYKNNHYDVSIFKKNDSVPGLPTMSVEGGTYYEPVIVVLEAENAEEIRYTTNGDSPLEAGYKVYDPDKPLVIDQSCMLKVVAVKGENISDIAIATYEILVETPVLSKEGGTYIDAVSVEISCHAGNTIRFTTDGTDPATSETAQEYDPDAPIYLTRPTELKAVALNALGLSSDLVSAQYVVQAENPVLSVAGGLYMSPQTVSISYRDGYTVYYTIDGTDPTTSVTAQEYDPDAPFYFERSSELSIVAYNATGLASEIISAQYTIKNGRNRFYDFRYTSEEDLAFYGEEEDGIRYWALNLENNSEYRRFTGFLHTEGLKFRCWNYIEESPSYSYLYWYLNNFMRIGAFNQCLITDLLPDDKIEVLYGPLDGIQDDSRIGSLYFGGATLEDESQKYIQGAPQWVKMTVDEDRTSVWFCEGYYMDENGERYAPDVTHYSGVFAIVVNPMRAQIGEEKFASFVTTGEVDFKATGIKAYVVKEITATSVKLTEIETAPKGTPVVIEGEADNWLLRPCDFGERISGNLLKSSDGTVVANGTHFTLAKKENGVGFYKVKDGMTIPEGKVYLTVMVAGTREYLGFDGEDIVTGINQQDSYKTENTIYTISGMRVKNPTKGLYIRDGKKIFIK